MAKQNLKSIVIVDDQNLFATGLKQILSALPLVGDVIVLENGNRIKEKLNMCQPDVLFLDLNLPGKNGLDILRDIRSSFSSMVIAILTMYEDQDLVKKVKDLKANAYLSKDASIEELSKTISSSVDSPFFVSTSLNFSGVENPLITDSFKEIAQLTTREKEVINYLVKGYSSDQISSALFISKETVKTHRKNIFRKLGLNKLQELIKFAYENNMA